MNQDKRLPAILLDVLPLVCFCGPVHCLSSWCERARSSHVCGEVSWDQDIGGDSLSNLDQRRALHPHSWHDGTRTHCRAANIGDFISNLDAKLICYRAVLCSIHGDECTVHSRSKQIVGARATWYFDIGSCRVVARLAGQHRGEPADAPESPIQSGLYSKVIGGDLVIRDVRRPSQENASPAMMPELRFDVPCSCGAENRVAALQAGTTVSCTKCGGQSPVPGLRELKQLPAVDISPLGRIQHSIESQDKPFDGSCQSCDAYVGTMVLPVSLVVASNEQEVGRSVTIPCIFCDMCANEFRKGLWVGRLQSLGNALLGAVWLLIVLAIASILAFLLPLVGLFAVLAIMSGVLYHLTRRSANPFLLRHLDRICKLRDALTDVDEYVVTSGKLQRFDVKP